jgi:hypothetical protein
MVKLQKTRKNYYLSAESLDKLEKICEKDGLNYSVELQIMINEKFTQLFSNTKKE